MQHMAYTIFMQASNMTLMSRLILGTPQAGCQTRHIVCPLLHIALFPDAVIAKAEEDIAKSETDLRPPEPSSGFSRGGHGGGRLQPYHTRLAVSPGWKQEQISSGYGSVSG